MVSIFFQEFLYLELVLQLQVQHLGLLSQFYSYVNTLAIINGYVHDLEVVGLNG